MKIIALLCVLVMLVSCGKPPGPGAEVRRVPDRAAVPADAAWGEPGRELQCSIYCDDGRVAPDMPRELVLRVRNGSAAPTRYSLDTCCGPTYRILASWANGDGLEFRQLVQKEHYPCGVTNGISLAAGETRTHRLPIEIHTIAGDEYLFVGAEVGAHVQQEGELRLRLGLADIESNTIVLNVRTGTP